MCVSGLGWGVTCQTWSVLCRHPGPAQKAHEDEITSTCRLAGVLCSVVSCGLICLFSYEMSTGTFGLISDHRKLHQKSPPPGWGLQALEATRGTLKWVVCPGYSLALIQTHSSESHTVTGTPSWSAIILSTTSSSTRPGVPSSPQSGTLAASCPPTPRSSLCSAIPTKSQSLFPQPWFYCPTKECIPIGLSYSETRRVSSLYYLL